MLREVGDGMSGNAGRWFSRTTHGRSRDATRCYGSLQGSYAGLRVYWLRDNIRSVTGGCVRLREAAGEYKRGWHVEGAQ